MKIISLLLFACAITTTSFCQTYITNVTIVDVEHQKLIPGKTVIITGNSISGIETTGKSRIPANALIIDGKGKFLMPGLSDAHVHFFQSGGLFTRPDIMDLRQYRAYEDEIDWVHNNMEDLLRRYIQAGITTVIDPGSTIRFLEQRKDFSGKSFSPAIFMTGPLLTTYEPQVYRNLKNDEPFTLITTTAEAKAAIQKQLPFRPDFIKVWFITDRSGKAVEDSVRKFIPMVKAVIEEAHKNKLRVAVHATERIAAEQAVANGCDFLVHSVDDEILSDKFIEQLLKNKVTLCPTLTVMHNYKNSFLQSHVFSSYELEHANPVTLGSLSDLKHLPDTGLVSSLKNKGLKRVVSAGRKDSIMKINLKRMSDAGVVIATGTDAGNIGTLHATSYVNELKAMKQSGMTNWQIIQASTLNGAKAIGKENEFGSIALGKKANLLLLEANPVDDLEHLKAIQLVINKGVAIDPDTLIKESPVQLVQRQLNAYNERNIDAFMDTYADEIELYTFPDVLTSKGKEAMRKNYDAMFKKFPALHCEIKNRIVQGNVIIDQEHVTGTSKKAFGATAVYHVENGKIRKVYFIR